MSKIFKRLLGLAAVGGAVAAGMIYYLNKSENSDDGFLDEFDDDFDLADDLNPAGEREYVSLNTAPEGGEPETEDKEKTVAETGGEDKDGKAKSTDAEEKPE